MMIGFQYFIVTKSNNLLNIIFSQVNHRNNNIDHHLWYTKNA
jgi:hypothetical protein